VALSDEAEPADTVEPEEEEEDEISFDEAYIETPRCTSCDECTAINPRMFAYNADKQAYIADVNAGTFRELVLAAEKCPVKIIHPGKPTNNDEPHLDELVARAEAFQ
jgi:ferredoxin